MALYLKVSNALESLAAGLSAELQQARNGVFDPHYIVTQTEGMNNWLKLQMADHLGIAANCRFLKPNELIQQVYYLLGGPLNEMLSVQNLGWLLFKLLGETEFMERYPSVAAYFRHSGPDKDTRRMALAEKLADLFDQYQVYRPDMIRQWNHTDAAATDYNEWQQYLWVKARKETHHTLPDKTVIGTYILDSIKEAGKKESLAARMPAIHLFGLSITTSYHVQVLFELSSFLDIYFHIINPAPSVFWFEDRSEKQLTAWRQKGFNDKAGSTAGNALLTGWGRVIQDSFGLFFEHDEFLNAYEDTGIVPPEPDSLLHKIQDDIFNAATTERNLLSPADIADGSITINACYTVAREVEVLYNYLVHLVDKRKELLSPRDMVVMVSDIDAYAPYIKAVFNHAPYKFRYTIADESYSGSDNLFNALHSILALNEDNFKAEEVLQLLDASGIRRRFGITDTSIIRAVVDAANIRFGLQGQRDDDTRYVSWEYGLKRIMYGICMSGEPLYDDGSDSFYPLDRVEGGDAQEIIRFVHFVEVLMDALQERKTPRSIAEWVVYVERVLHNLVFEPEEDAGEEYTLLMQYLSGYNVVNEYMQEPVPFDVFSRSFLKTLTGTTRPGLFVNGGITFCSLIPMRSIPFKVVALMGLNYDKFPRREQAASFNLLERKRRRGDRNVKENDKHLFLETILSARQYLYISYLGQNAKDNTLLPPSALVDELVDYIEAGAEIPGDARELLVTRQPLQGFSRKYQQGHERLYSYLDTVTAEAKPVTQETKKTEPLRFEEIALEDLVRFFKNPFKTWYNKVLGIYYDKEQVLLSDTEVFDLDSLQQWELKNELLYAGDAGGVALQAQKVKKGALPLKNMAEVAVRRVEEKVAPVRAIYAACTGNAMAEPVAFEVSIEGSLLKGEFENVFNGRLVQVSWSKKETKQLIEAYIRYLAGTAAGVISGLYFISGALKEKAYQAAPLGAKEAKRRLAGLIEIYREGFERIAPFYPDFDIKPAKVAELDPDKFAKLVRDALELSPFAGNDLYIMTEYRNGYFGKKDIPGRYISICEQVIVPLGEVFPGYYA